MSVSIDKYFRKLNHVMYLDVIYRLVPPIDPIGCFWSAPTWFKILDLKVNLTRSKNTSCFGISRFLHEAAHFGNRSISPLLLDPVRLDCLQLLQLADLLLRAATIEQGWPRSAAEESREIQGEPGLSIGQIGQIELRLNHILLQMT